MTDETIAAIEALPDGKYLVITPGDYAINTDLTTDDIKAVAAELKLYSERCEELEVVAAALYLGHDDAREQFDMYRSAYLTTADDDKIWKPTEDDPFPY